MIKLGVSQPKVRMLKRRDSNISLVLLDMGEQMISLYEIDDDYIEYLRKFDNKVLSPKAGERKFSRKYVGVLFHNKEYKYFIPLSSYKPEIYDVMYESISLKKIGNMAVLRINNMIPVVDSVIHRIDFSEEKDEQYRLLLQNEYRMIKSREREIRTDSRIVYHYQLNDRNKGKGLYKICCDFRLLEEKSKEYNNQDAAE